MNGVCFSVFTFSELAKARGHQTPIIPHVHSHRPKPPPMPGGAGLQLQCESSGRHCLSLRTGITQESICHLILSARPGHGPWSLLVLGDLKCPQRWPAGPWAAELVWHLTWSTHSILSAVPPLCVSSACLTSASPVSPEETEGRWEGALPASLTSVKILALLVISCTTLGTILNSRAPEFSSVRQGC